MNEWSELAVQHNNLLKNLPQSMQSKLSDFYTAQQELSQALLEAKPLGICKTRTSINTSGGTGLNPREARETFS